MATKFAPAFAMSLPVRPASSARSSRSNAWISMVPPDFEATTNSVFFPVDGYRPPRRPPDRCCRGRAAPDRRHRAGTMPTTSATASSAHPEQHDVRDPPVFTSAAKASSSARLLGISAGARSHPRRLLIDRSCDASLVKNVGVRLPDARPARGPSRASRRGRRSRAAARPAARASGGPRRTRAGRRAGRRPRRAASSSTSMNDFTPSSSRPWQTRDRSRPTAANSATVFLAPVEVVLDARAGLP